LKIVLIDDHELFREALIALLEKMRTDVEIVGAAGNARNGLAVIQARSPDLVILDVVMRGMNGISLARELARLRAKPRILILTAVDQPAFVLDALAAGVTSYALKADGADALLLAVERTSRGERYLAPTIAQYGDSAREQAPADGLIAALSRRERDVFDLAASGYSNEEISRELFISVKTVETHRAHINRKLHVHSTAQLIRLATLHGLAPH
jgi:DNA-binding NarL/FixJ family response regulator